MKIVDFRGKLLVHKTKRYKTRKLSDIRSIAIHHSLTTSGSPEAFANYHVNTHGWPGIAYTYVIQRDGTIYQCWDPTVVGYHVGDSNKHALGVCLVGDFRSQDPTPAQYDSAIKLVRRLQQEIPSAKQIKGHSEYPGYSWKACPVISMDAFRDAVSIEAPDNSKEEVPMTPTEKAAFDALVAKVNSLEHSKDVLKGGYLQQAATIKEQSAQIKELTTLLLELTSNTPPEWSKDAIQALHNTPSVLNGQPVVDTPDVATKTEARIFTVLHRLGLTALTAQQKGEK